RASPTVGASTGWRPDPCRSPGSAQTRRLTSSSDRRGDLRPAMSLRGVRDHGTGGLRGRILFAAERDAGVVSGHPVRLRELDDVRALDADDAGGSGAIDQGVERVPATPWPTLSVRT